MSELQQQLIDAIIELDEKVIRLVASPVEPEHENLVVATISELQQMSERVAGVLLTIGPPTP